MEDEEKMASQDEKKKEKVTGPVDNEYILKLSRPVKYDGKTYDKLDFTPFLSATLENMDTARRLSIMQGAGNDYYLERSYTFTVNLTAEVLKIPAEMLIDIPIQDAMALRNMVHRFL